LGSLVVGLFGGGGDTFSELDERADTGGDFGLKTTRDRDLGGLVLGVGYKGSDRYELVDEEGLLAGGLVKREEEKGPDKSRREDDAEDWSVAGVAEAEVEEEDSLFKERREKLVAGNDLAGGAVRGRSVPMILINIGPRAHLPVESKIEFTSR
jgi:hypothetical protein